MTTSVPLNRPLRSIGRAIADLRRGLAVALIDGDGSIAIARAAEDLTDTGLKEMRDLAKNTDAPHFGFIISARRAEVLHIPPKSNAISLRIGQNDTASDLSALADPTDDLTHPLRGPFARNEAPKPLLTESAIKLCKLARLLPSAVVVSVDAEATPTAAEALLLWMRNNDVLSTQVIEIKDFPEAEANALIEVTSAKVPLERAEDTRIVAFRPADGGIEHLAIIVGDPPRNQPVLTRLHSECFTGDLLGSLKCDCGDQLRGALRLMGEAGGGVLCYLAQEGRGIGLINKLRAYDLQDQGFDTVDANERLGFESDERIFQPAARMLHLLGFSQVRLMTNNPDKVAGLAEADIEVVERVAHHFPPNAHNERYLATKRRRSGHLL
jgi:GTP cyclohydrolase II